MLDSDGDEKVTSARDRCARAAGSMVDAMKRGVHPDGAVGSFVSEVIEELDAGLLGDRDLRHALNMGILAAWRTGRDTERDRVRGRVLDLLGVSDG